MLGTTGTFTSCKDYDDDINNLQSQVDGIKTTLAELQKAIENGKYVTSIVAEGNGLKITMNDGTSNVIENVINGETPKPGDVVTFDAETGEILINGEKTGYYASKDAETEKFKAPYVNDEGLLVLIDEEGKEVVTEIRVAPVTAVQNEDGSYTLTIWAGGEKQTVFVPSVSSLLSEIELVGYKEGTGTKVNGFYPMTESIDAVVFQISSTNAQKMAKDWKGNKAVLKENEITVAYDTKGLVARIAPTQVDGKSLEFSLINTKGEEAPVTIEMSDYTGKLTRAASTNSMYNVDMECVIGKANWGTHLAWAQKYYGNTPYNTLFALKEKGGLVSKYEIAIAATTTNPYTINEVYISEPYDYIDGKAELLSTGHTTAANPYEISAGSKYTMSLDDEPFVYDAYLEFEEDEALYWQVDYNKANDPMSFTIKKMPDSQTPAPLKITVHYATMDGTIGSKVVYVVPRTNLSAIVLCEPVKHNIVAYNAGDLNKNAIIVPLDKIFSTLGNDGTITWKADVDLTNTQAYIVNTTNSGLIADNYIVNFLDKDNKVTTDASKAVSVRFTFQNATAIDLSKDYLVMIDFASNKPNKYYKDIVNSAAFNASFSIPAFTDLLEKDMNVFDAEGKVASAYMLEAYDWVRTDVEATSTYKFNGAFNNLADNTAKGFQFTLALDANTNNKVVDNKTSAELAFLAAGAYNSTTTTQIVVNSTNANNVAITLTNADKAKSYGKELIVNLTNATYCNVYKYDNTSFKIKLLSPIKEGNYVANGGAVKITSTGTTVVTAEDVWATTANANVKYDLFKTAVKNTSSGKFESAWARKDLYEVIFSSDRIKFVVEGDGKPCEAQVNATTGAINTPSSISLRASGNPGDRSKLQIDVTDIWGYTLSEKVDVVVVE